MNIIEGELEYSELNTTMLESSKQVETRNGGKNLGLAERTGLSAALNRGCGCSNLVLRLHLNG